MNSQQERARGKSAPGDAHPANGRTGEAGRFCESLPPRVWDLRASMYPFEAVRDILDPFAAYPWAPDEDGWDRFEWGSDQPAERESLYARPEQTRPEGVR